MKCPNCDTSLGLSAVIPEDQRLSMVVTLEEGRMLSADTLGGMVTNFAKLMKLTGKQVGETKVETFIYAIRQEANKIEIEFALINVKTPPRKGDAR